MALGQERPARPRGLRAVTVAAAFVTIAGLESAGSPCRASEKADGASATGPRVPASPTGGTAAGPLAAPASPEPPVDLLAAAAARARRVTDSISEWASFTLIDRWTGRSVGDHRAAQQTNSESVVKAWLAADLLARRRMLSAYERGRMAEMIRVSDDDAAEVIWRSLGGDRSIQRMIETCRLTDTTVYPGQWSLTQISARDMARLGACLAPGPGRPLSGRAGAQLLALMRSVEPSNAFGIQAAEPAGRGVRLAVKNGWTEHGGTGLWNVNCLAMWGPELRWALAVALQYPIERGLRFGADACRRVTAALFP